MRSSARKEKLAAALRENLKRRKARARALKPPAEAARPEPETPAEARPNIAAKPG